MWRALQQRRHQWRRGQWAYRWSSELVAWLVMGSVRDWYGLAKALTRRVWRRRRRRTVRRRPRSSHSHRPRSSAAKLSHKSVLRCDVVEQPTHERHRLLPIICNATALPVHAVPADHVEPLRAPCRIPPRVHAYVVLGDDGVIIRVEEPVGQPRQPMERAQDRIRVERGQLRRRVRKDRRVRHNEQTTLLPAADLAAGAAPTTAALDQRLEMHADGRAGEAHGRAARRVLA